MSELVWYVQRGYGVLEPDPSEIFDYDEGYFERFRKISAERPGVALNTARCAFVAKYWAGRVLDVGVGSGAFLERWGPGLGFGYDIAEAPRRWLEERGVFRDVYSEPPNKLPPVFTLWDSMEHASPENTRELLSKARELVFVSLPIFERAEDVLTSKHFKPGEHITYWTEAGLIRFMQESGFRLLERNRMEEAYGREGIGTFAFFKA